MRQIYRLDSPEAQAYVHVSRGRSFHYLGVVYRVTAFDIADQVRRSGLSVCLANYHTTRMGRFRVTHKHVDAPEWGVARAVYSNGCDSPARWRSGGGAPLFFVPQPVLVLVTPAYAVGHKKRMKGVADIMNQFTWIGSVAKRTRQQAAVSVVIMLRERRIVK